MNFRSCIYNWRPSRMLWITLADDDDDDDVEVVVCTRLGCEM